MNGPRLLAVVLERMGRGVRPSHFRTPATARRGLLNPGLKMVRYRAGYLPFSRTWTKNERWIGDSTEFESSINIELLQTVISS